MSNYTKKTRKNQQKCKSNNYIHYEIGCDCGWQCTAKTERKKKILWRLHNKKCTFLDNRVYTGMNHYTVKRCTGLDKITVKEKNI